MSLRVRIAVTAALAVAVAVLITSLGVYAAASRTLNAQTDRELAQITQDLLRNPRRALDGGARTGTFGGAGGFVQLIGADGQVVGPRRDERLPVSSRAAQAIGGSASDRFYESIDIDDTPLRMLNTPLPGGRLLQIALPTRANEEALARLRRQLALGGLLGIALAAGLGTVVARRAVRPVQDLTELAEDVADTGDLARRIDVVGDDEIARLAGTLNRMLGSLEQARMAQQQLVADASHELRTPLTSLRTNIEVLSQVERLSPDDREALLSDVVGQLAEFGRLVDGLVELARGDQPAQGATPVRLDEVVELVVSRAQTFTTDREFVVTSAPTTVVAEADRLDRAVANLVDNAVKYGEGQVEVDVRDGAVRVRDHGPGIAAQDLPQVFDRFYRSPSARSAPGSGLGLSIVQQFAASHGGEATAANSDNGGAVLTLRLPVAPDAPTV